MRWSLAVLVGLIVMLPFSWLLSHAALLPFLLGLFFFVLFGVIIGAVMHRVAAARRPYAPRILVLGTTLVVAVGWSVSIIQESRDCPRKLAGPASERTRNIGDRSAAEFQADVAAQIRSYITEHYPPGGTIGYAQWVLADGELKKGDIAGVAVPLRCGQTRYLWAIRVVLSAALLGFGVGSQTFLLRLERDPAVRMKDEQREGNGAVDP